MKATVTFERDIEKVPDSCRACPFVDACDVMIHGITKRGFQFTVAAQRGRVKGCPLVVGGEKPKK